jgi:uncharacterized tellurite resistance protein B-like protein
MADGSISVAEEQQLEEHIERALALNDAERVRVSAHLVWLRESRPSLSGLKKRLEALDNRQRSAVADFVVGVAGADGHVSPEEIRTLSKIYPMLGLQASDVYSHVHAMASGAGGLVDDAEPVAIIPSQPSTGYAIPTPPTRTPLVQLDMAAVRAKLAESASVSAILGDIFNDDDVLPRAPLPSAVSEPKGPAAYRVLLGRLAVRASWTRTEYEGMAAECGLLPDAALDAVNELSFDRAGHAVLEGDDPIEVDVATAKELLL